MCLRNVLNLYIAAHVNIYYIMCGINYTIYLTDITQYISVLIYHQTTNGLISDQQILMIQWEQKEPVCF